MADLRIASFTHGGPHRVVCLAQILKGTVAPPRKTIPKRKSKWVVFQRAIATTIGLIKNAETAQCRLSQITFRLEALTRAIVQRLEREGVNQPHTLHG